MSTCFDRCPPGTQDRARLPTPGTLGVRGRVWDPARTVHDTRLSSINRPSGSIDTEHQATMDRDPEGPPEYPFSPPPHCQARSFHKVCPEDSHAGPPAAQGSEEAARLAGLRSLLTTCIVFAAPM